MKCMASENLLRMVEEGVPKNDYHGLSFVTKYYQDLANNLKEMQNVCDNQLNPSISNEDYFKKLFCYFTIRIHQDELDEFLLEYFSDNYQIMLLKTDVPITKYSVKENKTKYALLDILVAVKNGVVMDNDKNYSPEEIVTLQNQNKLLYLSNINDYARVITPGEFAHYDKSKNPLFIPLLNGKEVKITYVNYKALMNACPFLFDYLRSSTDDMHILLDSALGDYKIAVGDLMKQDIQKCDDKIEYYQKVKARIKVFGKE